MKNGLAEAIKKFRDSIDDKDYANLGAKGKYLTVPYRLKFVRDFFGERISIQTESTELSNGSHKFKANIYIDDKLVSVGESKQMQNKDKEFEKQQTVSIGRGLSILGFFGDELATAEEMEQFLKDREDWKETKGINNIPKPFKKELPKPKTNSKSTKQLADDWIGQMTSVAQHSKSQLYFEKNLTPIRENYKSDLISIAADPFEQLRVETAYNKLKSQIQNRSTNGR
jgi:hypothetical protein